MLKKSLGFNVLKKCKITEKNGYVLNIFTVVLILILFFLVMLCFAVRDNNIDRREKNYPKGLLAKLTYSAVMGKDIVVTPDEISGAAREMICQGVIDKRIKSVDIETNQVNPLVNVYITFESFKRVWGVVINADIHFNNERKEFEINIENFRIGSLILPKKLAIIMLSKFFKDSCYVENKKIYIGSTVKLKELNTEVDVAITKFRVEQGRFVVGISNSLVTLDGFVGEKVGKILSNICLS